MFIPLPTALLYVLQESGISALAKKANAKRETSAAEAAGAIPDAAAAPTLAPLAGPSSYTSPLRSASAQQPGEEVPDEDEVLCTDTLRILHQFATTFYSQWRPEAILGNHFGALRFMRTAAGMRVKTPAEDGPPRLLPLAAAAVMNLPWRERVCALQQLGDSHNMLRDIILSINKLGYAPLLEWLQHVTLNAGSDQDDADVAAAGGDESKDGEVVLSTIHACKGAACPCWHCVRSSKWKRQLLRPRRRRQSIAMRPPHHRHCTGIAPLLLIHHACVV